MGLSRLGAITTLRQAQADTGPTIRVAWVRGEHIRIRTVTTRIMATTQIRIQLVTFLVRKSSESSGR